MPRAARYTEEQVRAAVAGARSTAEALRLLGLRPAGGNHHTLRKLIALYELSTAHFDPYWGQRGPRRGSATPLEEILVEHSTYHRNHLKQRLLASGLLERRCEMCGQDEDWHGRRMSLVLDHINGVANDNRLENLRMVCANCAATLDTHCGRNLPRERVCPGCGTTFAPREMRHRYCSQTCWGRTNGASLRGVPLPATRKVERPSYEQLMADLRSTSFVAVGRKYGVSDNAIRKWIRWYERAHERERDGAGGGRGCDGQAA